MGYADKSKRKESFHKRLIFLHCTSYELAIRVYKQGFKTLGGYYFYFRRRGLWEELTHAISLYLLTVQRKVPKRKKNIYLIGRVA